MKLKTNLNQNNVIHEVANEDEDVNLKISKDLLDKTTQNEPLKRSESTDSSGNMNFSDTLKSIRQEIFAKQMEENLKLETQPNTEQKDNYLFKKHESFCEKDNNYFKGNNANNNSNSRGLAQLKNSGLAKPVEPNNSNEQNDNFSKALKEKFEKLKEAEKLKEEQLKKQDKYYLQENESKENPPIKQNENNIRKSTITKSSIQNQYKKSLNELEYYGIDNPKILQENEIEEQMNIVKSKIDKKINFIKKGEFEVAEKIVQNKEKEEEFLSNVKSEDDKILKGILSEEKIEKIIKRKRYVYNMYLINRYNEAKFKRMTWCGLVFIVVLGLLATITFSESIQKQLIEMINNIPIEIEIN